MKQLKFNHQYVAAIVDGARTTTLRIDDKDIQIGEHVQLVDKVSNHSPQEWEVPGELNILGRQEFSLEHVPLELLVGTELESSDRDALEAFLRRFYGDEVTDQTVVTLLSFRYEPYAQPVPYLVEEELSGSRVVNEVYLYADGGSRGNPGPSAAGFVIEDVSGTVLQSWNTYLGMTTNNQAEYHGLIAALEWCKQHHVQMVHVRLDSLLVVNQMKGKFKVKNRDLWALYESAKRLQGAFRVISFEHVPRELNKRADAEVNKALDAISGEEVVQ